MCLYILVAPTDRDGTKVALTWLTLLKLERKAKAWDSRLSVFVYFCLHTTFEKQQTHSFKGM